MNAIDHCEWVASELRKEREKIYAMAKRIGFLERELEYARKDLEQARRELRTLQSTLEEIR